MLKMLRPIRLDAFCDVLTVEPRRLKALRLVYDFFPAEIPNVLHYRNWWDVTSYFLRQVNATWFEIDWSSIDGIFQWSHEEQWSLLYDLQDPLNDESEIEGAMDSSKWLAKTLDVVPVNCLGFWDDFGGGGSDIDEYPPLELLRYLLLPASPYTTKIWDEFFAKLIYTISSGRARIERWPGNGCKERDGRPSIRPNHYAGCQNWHVTPAPVPVTSSSTAPHTSSCGSWRTGIAGTTWTR